MNLSSSPLVRCRRRKIPVQHIRCHWKVVFAVRRHLELTLLLYFELQRLHQTTRLVAADFEATQIVHHHATAEAVSGGSKQLLHAAPQKQLLGRYNLAGPDFPVVVGAALNAEHVAQQFHRIIVCLIANKPVLHFISMAKYWLAFLESLSPSAAGGPLCEDA